ncbi:TIGR02556 family CRISPR-associated protein [Clostridium polynesiense]|uniref:TIGR02556 family CRISPR-associated protein n=1 Tax=Clostridium polynesiense TaxID=1325933 RepID=UPI00058DDF36|nr:TIGR02556 family CRISPR-associated protein [Clostridium polynesiense]
MQEAILQLGNAILDSGNLLDNLVKEVEPIKNKKQLQVLKIIFNTENNTYSIECSEEMNLKTSKKYLFIGSAPGANSPQWYCTSTNSFYHFSETVYNLMNRQELGDELCKKLQGIFNSFYEDIGSEFKSAKNRYLLNLKKLKEELKSPLELLEDFKKQGLEGKELKDSLKKDHLKELEAYLKEEFNLSLKDIGLFTIFLDNTPLSDYKEYREALIKEKQVDSCDKGAKSSGSCIMCGSTDKVTSKFDTEIKFYTTNQVIFANGLDPKNYDKSYTLCEECLNKTLVAEKYLINNLNTRLADFNVYLIPHFIIGEPANKEELDYSSEKLKKSFNLLVNHEAIGQFQESLKELLEYERDGRAFYLINLFFYKRVQKSTKVQKLIKDINPSNFIELDEAMNKTNNALKRIYGENFSRNLSLKKIYYLVPIRIKSGEVMQYRRLMAIYEALFTGGILRKELMVAYITESIKAIHFKQRGLNVTDNGSMNFDLSDGLAAAKLLGAIIDGQAFLYFLKILGCIKEEKGMDVALLNVNDEIKGFITQMDYTEEQAALFLLGNVLGAIGNAQYKKSAEGKKPILNKLNFNGMNKIRLMKLTNEIFNKLKQEKLLPFNDVLFSQFKMLFDKNYNIWSLNKEENLFYILSGYGYSTNKAILKKEKENNHEK